MNINQLELMVGAGAVESIAIVPESAPNRSGRQYTLRATVLGKPATLETMRGITRRFSTLETAYKTLSDVCGRPVPLLCQTLATDEPELDL